MLARSPARPLARAASGEQVLAAGGVSLVIDSSLCHQTDIEALLARHGRIGGASALFAVGCSPETIKAMGRWWSGAYLLYIRAMQGNARSLMVAACSHKGEYLPDAPDDDSPEDSE